MSVIKLNGIVHPIPEEVGDYIDKLVELKQKHLQSFQGISKTATVWLKSNRNTIDRAVEKTGFSLIKDLAAE